MAWIAIDADGIELIYQYEPTLCEEEGVWMTREGESVQAPSGTAALLTHDAASCKVKAFRLV